MPHGKAQELPGLSMKSRDRPAVSQETCLETDSHYNRAG